MIAGFSGSLLSEEAVERLLERGEEGLGGCDPDVRRAVRTVHAAAQAALRPAAGPRRVYDALAEPFFRTLGYAVLPVRAGKEALDALLGSGSSTAAVLVVTAWGSDAGAFWRHAVHAAIAHDVRWCLCATGPAVRLFDAARAYARRFVQFDLTRAVEDDRAWSVLVGLLGPPALNPADRGARLDRIVSLCEQHRAEVRTSLREGVCEAILRLVGAFRAATGRHPHPRLLDESLTVVYRILFLLFAEARGLVPRWHPVYRDGYTVESLCSTPGNAAPRRGVWEALQAIARLAHAGCRAGTLRVAPFNGRLFSPSEAPLADSLPLDDGAVGDALGFLTVRKGRSGPERISYAELGVEQLGAVYEHLLEFDAVTAGPGEGPVLVPTGRRKATGSFYTPRPMADFLVRRTLAPLLADASPDAILRIRVLDPAMGSGAFLVSACRYLASAYESALLREGALAAGDVDDRDRAGFRRLVARQCLYGVDANPAAVALARLSLWLATSAADRPLTFFDHHLRTGNSLAGTTAEAIGRRPAPGSRRTRRRDLPLFLEEELQASLPPVVSLRRSLAETPDDTVEDVRGKEKAFASLARPDAPLARWRAAGDLWCAAWWKEGRLPSAAVGALLDQVLRGGGALPRQVAGPMLVRAGDIAAERRFFHWPFEFPELFYDAAGRPLPAPGFDVVVGNPPWEMLRRDRGPQEAAALAPFTRSSGIYTLQGAGHGNLYQLFLERALHLLKPNGRCGLILPAGFAGDQTSAPLRRHLLSRTALDTFTVVENRDRIFPVHRDLKFLLVTFTRGGTTRELPVRTSVRTTAELDGVPDAGPQGGAVPVPRMLLERMSGEGLAVPEIRSAMDLAICTSIVFRVPALGEPAGWNVRFGRELNATEDRPAFRVGGSGLPVLEGKRLQAFRVDAGRCEYRIARRDAARILRARGFERSRLAYRDIASATNRMTLIAAIVPAGVVTTHTVFCLKDPLDETAQQYLCGILNSFVANYFVRLRVGTHVTASMMARLPVPRPATDDALYVEIAALSRALSREPDDRRLARLDALVGRLYGLSDDEFAHVVAGFPLVPARQRDLSLRAFRAFGRTAACGSRSRAGEQHFPVLPAGENEP